MKHELSAEYAKWLIAAFGDPSKVTWTLAEQIATRLSEDIIRGVYQPGDPLLETTLAENYFQVSRGPVREALRILESEGLVEIRPRRGAIVTQLSAQDIKEIFSVRAVLYGYIARELACHRSRDTLATLHAGSLSVQQALENNVDQFIAALYRMSMYLAQAAGNSYARKIIFSLGRQTLATTRRAMLNPDNCRVWIGNWLKIVDAIDRCAADEAEAAGRKLVHDVYDATLRVIDDAAACKSKLVPAKGAETGVTEAGNVT